MLTPRTLDIVNPEVPSRPTMASAGSSPVPERKPKLLDQFREAMRSRHYMDRHNIPTEKVGDELIPLWH